MDKVQLADRSAVLRAELKQWEKEFATAHGGRKATRDEIKEVVDIASKYKEYHKTQDILSGKIGPPKVPSKRKLPVELPDAPSPKRQRPTNGTPRKHVGKFQEIGLDDESPLSLPVEVTPRMKRTFVGPTPQKDGHVLGLFDLLPMGSTPTKARDLDRNNRNLSDGAFQPISANVHLSTPLRRSRTTDLDAEENDNDQIFATTQKPSRTPQSATKRYLLDSFMTPSKRRRRLDDASEPCINTPSSSNKHFATPTFLRRDSYAIALDTVTEEENQVSASPSQTRGKHSRWQHPTKRRLGFGKPVGAGVRKSLSSMIADLRRQEDERLDEEMDLLREMEGSENREGASRLCETFHDNSVGHGQHTITLGPDGTDNISEDENLDASATANTTGKVWKKRGQKRQTRRVIMRPVARKKPSTSTVTALETDASVEIQRDETIPETQLDDSGENMLTEASHLESREAALNSNESESTSEKKKLNDSASNGGIVKKAARKVSATAHANFRRLKIRSGNPGGKGGGRFGRRR